MFGIYSDKTTSKAAVRWHSFFQNAPPLAGYGNMVLNKTVVIVDWLSQITDNNIVYNTLYNSVGLLQWMLCCSDNRCYDIGLMSTLYTEWRRSPTSQFRYISTDIKRIRKCPPFTGIGYLQCSQWLKHVSIRKQWAASIISSLSYMYLGGPVSEPEAFKRTDRRKIYSNTGGFLCGWYTRGCMYVPIPAADAYVRAETTVQ